MKKAFWIMMAVLCVSIAINVWQWRHQPEAETRVEHDTVWRDSIIREPLPAETINTGKVVYIKIPVGYTQGTGTAVPSGDSTGASQSPCIADSIKVPVLIQQKRYDDSLYTAWVSGYEPNLDSIDLRLPEVQTTITKTVIEPSPLITFGIQAGGGYGMINRKPDFYIGIGGQINLWRVKRKPKTDK